MRTIVRGPRDVVLTALVAVFGLVLAAVPASGTAVVTLTAPISVPSIDEPAIDVAAAVGPSGAFVALPPDRIADSRIGLQINGPIPGGATVSVAAQGWGRVPSTGVSAVVLTVTVTEPVAAGFLTAFASGTARPLASNLNFLAGQTVPNLVIAPVGADGRVALFNGAPGPIQLVADIAGYYLSGAGLMAGGFAPVPPTRLLDTRGPIGVPQPGPVRGGGTVSFQVAGLAGVPAAAAVSAVVLNVTVTEPGAAGFLTAFASGGSVPATSNVNFLTGQTVPNLVVVPVGKDGRVTVFNGAGAGAHVVADVFGYFRSGAAPAAGGFGLVAPARLLDTRYGIGATRATVPGGGTVQLAVAGISGIPTGGVAAVVLNVTVTEPGAAGYVTAFASGRPLPLTSNVNFLTGQTVPNLVMAPVGADGRVSLFNGSAQPLHLIADVSGYFLAGPLPPAAGVVQAWGYGGALGSGSATDSSEPVEVTGLTGMTAIAGGSTAGYAVAADGTVRAWGYGRDGELGNGTTEDSATPVTVSGLTHATAVAGGQASGYALLADGTVRAWGYDAQGRLGNGSRAGAAVTVPVKVGGLSGVTAIAAGAADGYALRSDGTVWAWGAGSSGELGNNALLDSAVPVQISALTGVVGIAGSFYGGYALRADGTIWAWGSGFGGRLGNGQTTQSAVPVRVGALTGMSAVAGGGFNGYALRSDGTVWAWGYGASGQLGTGSSAGSAVPVQVSGLSGISAVAGGSANGYALRGDGTVWAWGSGSSGQLGDGRWTDSSVPVQVTGVSGAIAVAGGDFVGYALS